MELAPVGQVRQRLRGVVLAVAVYPVRRRGDLVGRIAGFSVALAVAVPRDTLGRHFVRFVGRAGPAGDVEEDRRGEAVVEHGVRDKPTGVVRLAIRVRCERGAIAVAVKLGPGAVIAGKLLFVK